MCCFIVWFKLDFAGLKKSFNEKHNLNSERENQKFCRAVFEQIKSECLENNRARFAGKVFDFCLWLMQLPIARRKISNKFLLDFLRL